MQLDNISELIPNLDALDNSELCTFTQEALEIARNFQLLASYAQLRSNAAHLRQTGCIDKALALELQADVIFQDLQPWATW